VQVNDARHCGVFLGAFYAKEISALLF